MSAAIIESTDIAAYLATESPRKRYAGMERWMNENMVYLEIQDLAHVPLYGILRTSRTFAQKLSNVPSDSGDSGKTVSDISRFL